MNHLELKKIRKKLNLSQEKFAEKLNISKSIVQKWEQNNRKIPDSMSLLIKSFDEGSNLNLPQKSILKDGVFFSELEIIDWVVSNIDYLKENNKYFKLEIDNLVNKKFEKHLKEKGFTVKYTKD